MATDRIPPEATVSVNVRSFTSALRDFKTLGELGDFVFVLDSLGKLADRVEEMYHEQQSAEGMGTKGEWTF